MGTHQISITLPDDVYRDISTLAKDTGRSRKELVGSLKNFICFSINNGQTH